MKHRLKARRMTWLGGALVATALATMAPGAVATASAQTTSSPPTLTLGKVNLNLAGLQLSNAPSNLTNQPQPSPFQIPGEVLDGQTVIPPDGFGNETASLDGADGVSLDFLPRGKTFNISVKYTDPDTGQMVQTNTVTFSTPPSTDTTPPTTPTNLHFVELPQNGGSPPGEYDLQWNPSRDNETQGFIQYIITRNGQPSGENGQFVKGDVFTVTAIDSSNNKSKPATITFTGQTRP